MLLEIATNVIANVVFWLGLGLAVAAMARVAQRRFRGFFGLRTNQQLIVCLSNLWTAAESSRPRGYSISLHELRASEAITRLFGSASFRLPDLVRGLVDAIYLGRHRYDFRTEVSPSSSDDPRHFSGLSGNLIVVGAAARNSIRRLYLQENLVSLRISSEHSDAGDEQLSQEAKYVEVLNGADLGQLVTSDSLDLAVVEKVHDTARGTTVVFCLGRRGDTTWAATEYLARNWRSLQREFGDRPFALCLGFRDPGYQYDYHPPRRLLTLRG
ncbi:MULTISPECIES: hypothetical protein [Amycolatopsis]|uniref:Uncharacterized protein n=1 Tax=Amycolatopsis dendrobii TaxID=2760662 RepID=A0A7W3W222_9PSEU|nr:MULTISPECIES: hypothetical protein [Amycolatopsis]MBB1157419.1 hypothetical protein [Amycolatopsis dendrobii]UKD59184.1 hypothetical protein L3Q65_21480 [Amycolatopsis sp. FU40]